MEEERVLGHVLNELGDDLRAEMSGIAIIRCLEL